MGVFASAINKGERAKNKHKDTSSSFIKDLLLYKFHVSDMWLHASNIFTTRWLTGRRRRTRRDGAAQTRFRRLSHLKKETTIEKRNLKSSVKELLKGIDLRNFGSVKRRHRKTQRFSTCLNFVNRGRARMADFQGKTWLCVGEYGGRLGPNIINFNLRILTKENKNCYKKVWV